MIRTRTSLAFLFVILVAGGCSGDRSNARPPRVGDPLPEFTAPMLDGDVVGLSAYRGSPVLVNLWATWCPPCRAEMPFLEEIGREYGPDGLRIVGISTDHAGAVAQIRSVLEERGVTYDILLDTESRSTDLFGAFGLPATFLADAEGTITWTRLGPVMENDAAFEAALAAVTGRAGS
ncbi:MAG: TlpA disulfide reductase family protein [Longimicrobiales bacterium]|nr:TlpA disulfide reductase family protein [Longimicrobiales bacterium]